MTQSSDVQRQLILHKKRLQILKEQQAIAGVFADPRIPIEIEQIESVIAELQQQMDTNLESSGKHEAASMSLQPLIRFLVQFDEFRTEDQRYALLIAANLQEVLPKITLGGPALVSVPRLLQTLREYGRLRDGQMALDVLLDTFEQMLGPDRQAELRHIRRALGLDGTTKPTIGIITALPKEYAAMKALLVQPEEDVHSGQGAGLHYTIGSIPARRGGTHRVALALQADMGNNSAAIRTDQLLQHYRSVKWVLMVGIAGGVPSPKEPAEHVRLGDIAVSSMYGAIQYDMVKETVDAIHYRPAPRPPSATLLDIVRHFEAGDLAGQRPWIPLIEQTLLARGVHRPDDKTDILVDSRNERRRLEHPADSRRIAGQPRVFIGPIGSGNSLQKNPLKRDELRDRFKVKAIEMEGSGVADAAWTREVGYLIVRGISDYCDSRKNDDWQAYAAHVAACYARVLIAEMSV